MTQPNPPRGFPAFLLATAAITGALVMVVEVLGSRVIGPFFGVSLFVWTALITVTLLALAAGYAVGGWWADRNAHPARLYALIIASGVLIALVPLLKVPVLTAALPLGLRLGAFVAAFVLFGPGLFLLGCVSPFLVRIAVTEHNRLGRTVGGFYAVSTAGSFVGTVGTGFLVIGYLGVDTAFVAVGALLVLLGAVYFAWFQRRFALLAAPVLLAALLPSKELPSARLPDGTMARVVHRADSFYGAVRVVDYEGNLGAVREMIIDGLVQSGVDRDSGLSVYEYSYLLQFLPRALNPSGRSCLVIGLGAGVVPRWYAAQGVATEVVDIDPGVVAAAKDYFGFVPAGAVHIEDARYFLGTTAKRYDYVILDVFNGDTTPGHLLSVEALTLAKSRLTDGGVLAMNLVGSVRGADAMTRSVLATVRKVFAEAAVHPLFDPQGEADGGNMVIVAYDGAPRAIGALPDAPIHPLAAARVRAGFANPLAVDSAGALILTDDFNPLDVRDIAIKERVRRQILDTTPAAILLSLVPTAAAREG